MVHKRLTMDTKHRYPINMNITIQGELSNKREQLTPKLLMAEDWNSNTIRYVKQMPTDLANALLDPDSSI